MKNIQIYLTRYIFTTIFVSISLLTMAGPWESGGDRRGTIPGDYNLDGKVSIDEVVRAINNYVNPNLTSHYLDFDDDGEFPEINEVRLVISSFLDIDEDKDGILDTWEVVHKLDPTINDGRKDLDEDGIPNLKEFYYLTDPRSESPILGVKLLGFESKTLLDGLEIDFTNIEAAIAFGDTVQLDYSPDGVNWQEISVSIHPNSDLISSIWSYGTLPSGAYFIRAVARDNFGNQSADLKYVELINTLPAPYFVSPKQDRFFENEVVKFEIDQFLGTSDYISVVFEQSRDGLNFFPLGEDFDGADGWAISVDLNEIEVGGTIVRAIAKNTSGRSAHTFITIPKLEKTNIFNPSSVIAANFIDPPFEITSLPQELRLDVGAFKRRFNILGSVQATLIPHLLDTEVKQTSLQGISSEEDIFNFSLDRLIPGNYYITAYLEAFTDEGLVQGYAQGIEVAISDRYRHFLPLSPIQTLFTERDFEQSLVEADYTRTFNIIRDSLEGDFVFRKHTLENAPEIDLGIAGVFNEGSEITVFILRVKNNQDIPITNTLLVNGGYWDESDTAIVSPPQEYTVTVEAGGSQYIEFIHGGEWGRGEDFSFINVQAIEFGENVQFLADISLSGNVYGYLGNQFGTNELFLGNFYSNAKDDFTYPTYYWERCTKVRDVLPDHANPNLSYEWTITNTDGSSWKRTGKEVIKHAAILGGPHKVRVVCKAQNVEVATYGSDHYVFNNLRQVSVEFDRGYPKNEYKRGGIVTGPNGPAPEGGGEITISETETVTEKTSIETSVGGTLGEKGVASIESKIGATSTSSVTKTTSIGQKYKYPKGKCITVYVRLCFKIWKGNVVFKADGQTIKVPFEAKVLESVGLEPVVGDC